jgi:hypothetical protein
MSTAKPMISRGSCECGACSFDLNVLPKARFRCHCLICQEFNDKPFADVVAVRARNVVLRNAEGISFKKYRAPPNFDRGLCRICNTPVIEIMSVGPLKVMFIPVTTFGPNLQLPSPRMDIFYHRRVMDITDGLPRYSGYFASELAVGKLIMSGL